MLHFLFLCRKIKKYTVTIIELLSLFVESVFLYLYYFVILSSYNIDI